MKSPAYRRWAELYDRQLAGESLSPLESAELGRLSVEDRASAHELLVRQQLSALDCQLDGPDQAVVERALFAIQERDNVIHLRKPQETSPAPLYSPRPRRTLAWAALGSAAAAATAAATAALFWSSAPEEAAAVLAPVTPPGPAELTFTSGDVRINGQPTLVGALALEPKSRVSVGQGHACLAINRQTDVCLDANTEAVLDDQRGQARTLHLGRGRAVAVLEKRPAERSFSVIAGSVTATALGTAFAVERDAHGAIQVSVMEGRVQVARADTAARVVHAGEQLQNAHQNGAASRQTTRAENLRHWALVAPRRLWQAPSVGILHLETAPHAASVTLDGTALGSTPLSLVLASGEHQLFVEREGHEAQRERFRLTPGQERRLSLALPAETATSKPPAAPAAPAMVVVPSAQDLLKRARTLVGHGDWQGAAAAYQRLRSAHPQSPESHTVLVALGQLQLDRLGQPRQALRSFDAYLKAGGGGLAREARFSSIRAQRALGDRHAEARAIRGYLRQYPQGVDAARLTRRLTELE
ncbi:MAG TPA: PEGA domain-containing protein [Polyangiaceae bacterium]